jgi:hypothetical protein
MCESEVTRMHGIAAASLGTSMSRPPLTPPALAGHWKQRPIKITRSGWQPVWQGPWTTRQGVGKRGEVDTGMGSHAPAYYATFMPHQYRSLNPLPALVWTTVTLSVH